MEDLLNIIVSFPTVIWSIPMVLVVCYWGLALLGAVGVDALDLDLDGDADVDLDVDADADVDSGMLHGLGELLAIGAVPLTLVLTFITGTGWFSSLLLDYLLGDMLRDMIGVVGFSLAALLVTFLAGVFLTSRMVQPLRPMFKVHTNHGQQYLIGKTAVVSSTKVTTSFGTGTASASDGSELLLNLYVEDESHLLAKGDEVVILDYDDDRSRYLVVPLSIQARIKELDASLAVAEGVDSTHAADSGESDAETNTEQHS